MLYSKMSIIGPLRSRRGPRADGIRAVLGMLALMWVVQIINAADSYGLDNGGGIVPRNVSHLPGIVFAPFLHASFGHLLGNTIPFVVLGGVIAMEGVRRVLTVTALVAVVSGLGVWLVASGNTDTVGASGVIFGYATYLIGRGVFNKKIGQLLIGAAVGIVFGITLLWDLIPHPGVSWQGHLFGALGGLLAARVLTPAGSSSRSATPVTPAPTV